MIYKPFQCNAEDREKGAWAGGWVVSIKSVLSGDNSGKAVTHATSAAWNVRLLAEAILGL